MCLPRKEYFSLEEIVKLWNVSNEDLLYYGENELLEICIRYTAIRVALGKYRKRYGSGFEKILEGEKIICAPQPLHATDIYRIIKSENQPVIVERLKSNSRFSFNHIIEENGIHVRLSDLVVTRAEKIRFEQENDIITSESYSTDTFKYTNSFQEVIHFGKRHHFGLMQAKIIELLFEARNRNEPWVHGKTLLAMAGSESLRFTSLFKGHKSWREIIFSDHNGYYRLNIPSWKQLELPITTP